MEDVMKESILTGGQVLAQTLHQANVKDIFTLHGGHLDGLFKACKDLNINLYDTRHEASAGHAAEAYARIKGDLGVCVVTSGPGFTNVITSVVNAFSDHTPVLFIVGAPPLRETDTNPLQGGFDQIGMIRPAVKYAFRITNVERIPDQIALAIREARNAPCGPVLVEVPIDVLHMIVHRDDLTQPTGLEVVCKSAPTDRDVQRIVDRLKQAKRPIVIAGGSARFSHCEKVLTAFANRYGIPVFTNPAGRGLIKSDHPLNFSDPAMLALVEEQYKPDVILNLGARSGMFLGGRSKALINESAYVIQIHPSIVELGRVNKVDLAIQADHGEVLEKLLQADFELSVSNDWIEYLKTLKSSMYDHYPAQQEGKPIHPFHGVKEVLKQAGDHAVIVLEGGENGLWVLEQADVNYPGYLLPYGMLGCLGTSAGFALGASIADPKARVIIISGDGAFGFHLQELDSMMRHDTPVINVVMNNEVWGMSIHGQELLYGKGYYAVSKLGKTSYAEVGKGFGCYAEKVTKLEDISGAIQRAIDSGITSVIEVMTDPNITHPAMEMMLTEPKDPSKEIMIPYYENIPLRNLG